MWLTLRKSRALEWPTVFKQLKKWALILWLNFIDQRIANICYVVNQKLCPRRWHHGTAILRPRIQWLCRMLWFQALQIKRNSLLIIKYCGSMFGPTIISKINKFNLRFLRFLVFQEENQMTEKVSIQEATQLL